VVVKRRLCGWEKPKCCVVRLPLVNEDRSNGENTGSAVEIGYIEDETGFGVGKGVIHGAAGRTATSPTSPTSPPRRPRTDKDPFHA